ncbi:MAG: DoxX family protein [Candidatus Acidiferrales bacterium]
MPTVMETAGTSKAALWTGRILSGLIVLLMLFTSAFGFIKPDLAREGMAHLGYPYSLNMALGIVMLACTLIYAIPQTSILGAILLTGYFGGATASHVRIGEPFYFPVAIGVLAWVAVYLRDHRLRSLVPFRS